MQRLETMQSSEMITLSPIFAASTMALRPMKMLEPRVTGRNAIVRWYCLLGGLINEEIPKKQNCPIRNVAKSPRIKHVFDKVDFPAFEKKKELKKKKKKKNRFFCHKK